MKKLLKISLLAFIVLILNINTNYAATPTISDIATKLNSVIPEISSQVNTYTDVDGLGCIATATENTLTISLQFMGYDDNYNYVIKETELYTYSLSGNILSRTTSYPYENEKIVFKLLIDCIGQLQGHKPGDLYYTLNFSDSDEDNNIYDLSSTTYNNIYNLNLEEDGISAQNLNNDIYEFKIDITKTVDFSNTYITEEDAKEILNILKDESYPISTKGFIRLQYMYLDDYLQLTIAEKNNLTENSYKSIISLINVLFRNSKERIDSFKNIFSSLSVGDTSFDGIDITVAPTVEEADFEYWRLNYNTTYKLVVLSIPYKYIDEEEIEDDNITTPSTPKPSPSNILPTPTPTPTKQPSTTTTDKLQQNVDKVTGSISKLPQTGRFLNLEDSLILLSIFSLLVLITIIIKDIKYKNITKK